MRCTFAEFLVEGYDLDSLKKRKVALTPEERDQVIKAGAVWSDGRAGVWKAKDAKGNFVYGSNTHRAFSAEKSLATAIKKFDFIKSTS